MKKSDARFFALDIGNVCMKVDAGRCLEALGYSSMTDVPVEFMMACDRLETGGISTDEWLSVFRKVTNGKFTDERLVNAWRQILGDEIPGICGFLDEITKSGYRIIFFSDTSEVHLDFVYRLFPGAIFVSGGIFSFKVGCKKPGNGMYEAFEKLYGVPSFYTDDRLDNIEAGLRRGWPSHQFTGVEKLRQAFYS